MSELSQNLNQQVKNKNYIQKIQSEIDNLEKQLFSEKKEKEKEREKEKHEKVKKKGELKFNKDLSVPVETTLSNINDETLLTQQTILNSNLNPNEKAELYKIIMRERNENAELEKLRIEQNEKFKELMNKCKMLELNNDKLKNEVNMLKRDKEAKELQIMQLQKEIQQLKGYN